MALLRGGSGGLLPPRRAPVGCRGQRRSRTLDWRETRTARARRQGRPRHLNSADSSPSISELFRATIANENLYFINYASALRLNSLMCFPAVSIYSREGSHYISLPRACNISAGTHPSPGSARRCEAPAKAAISPHPREHLPSHLAEAKEGTTVGLERRMRPDKPIRVVNDCKAESIW